MSSTYSRVQKPMITKRGNLSPRLTTILDPDGAASEAYRVLYANLLYASAGAAPKVIMVTSPGSAEGKSTVCANLGVALAQAGMRSLIMDCDLRKPTMHRIFGLNSSPGIVDVVAGECSLSGAYQEPLRGLKVLTVGTAFSNVANSHPAKLLGSQGLSKLLAETREEFDYVLVDSSPMGMVSDPLILATQVDGVLLILDARKTRRGEVRRAMRGLTTVGADVLGMVMNRVVGSKNNDQAGPYFG